MNTGRGHGHGYGRDRYQEDDKKKLEELKTLVRNQETRLQSIQSTAFQLANYYFVFQGVILTAICNGSTSLKCSDRWFLFTVSLLAASLNLLALWITGLEYISYIDQRDRNWNKCNEIERRLLQTDHHHHHLTQCSPLHDHQSQPSPFQTQHSPTSSSLSSQSYVSARSYLSPIPPAYPQRAQFADPFKKAKYYFLFGAGMSLFVGFAGVTLSGCWIFLCRKNDMSSKV